jgi:taurine dioxygenase
MTITVRKIAHALGAEVSGVDISRPIDDQTFSEINRAFLENCVLVFHDQPLTREQQVAFSSARIQPRANPNYPLVKWPQLKGAEL